MTGEQWFDARRNFRQFLIGLTWAQLNDLTVDLEAEKTALVEFVDTDQDKLEAATADFTKALIRNEFEDFSYYLELKNRLETLIETEIFWRLKKMNLNGNYIADQRGEKMPDLTNFFKSIKIYLK